MRKSAGSSRSSDACAHRLRRPCGTRHVSFMVFGDPAELKAYQTLVAAFEQKHPEIQIDLIHIPDQGDYRTRLQRRSGRGHTGQRRADQLSELCGLRAQGRAGTDQAYLDQEHADQRSRLLLVKRIQPFIWRRTGDVHPAETSRAWWCTTTRTCSMPPACPTPKPIGRGMIF